MPACGLRSESRLHKDDFLAKLSILVGRNCLAKETLLFSVALAETADALRVLVQDRDYLAASAKLLKTRRAGHTLLEAGV